MRSFFLFISSCFLSVLSFAQIREVPQLVKDSFEKKYPNADSTVLKDNLVNVHANFHMNGVEYHAIFSNKGQWKQTEKTLSVEELNSEINDGYAKSKYAGEWKIKSAALLTQPRAEDQYRLKVEKNEVQKKYLYFNSKGRLLRDALTL